MARRAKTTTLQYPLGPEGVEDLDSMLDILFADLDNGNLEVTVGQITGVLPIANGGTNGTATPTLGGVAYGTGTAFAFTAAGTSGYVLTSQGAAAPIWAVSTGYSAAKVAARVSLGF